MGDETASPRKRRDKSRPDADSATSTGPDTVAPASEKRRKRHLWTLYGRSGAREEESRQRSRARRRSRDRSSTSNGTSRPASSGAARHKSRAHPKEKRERSTPSKRKDSSRLSKAKKLPPKEMIEAIAKADSEEDPPPTSPVASQEIIMDSPENAPDAAEEDLAHATPLPVQEDSLARKRGKRASSRSAQSGRHAATSARASQLAIQDVPQYVQDRLAEAEAAAGIAAPEEAYHDRRLCNNLQFPP